MFVSTVRSPNDEAVSAVVAMVFMIAITVVLAGLAFILFSGFASDEEPDAARVGLLQDDSRDRVVIVKAPDHLRWADFSIQMSVAGDFDLSKAVDAGADAIPAGEFVPLGDAAGGPADGPLQTGGFISLCATAGSTNDVTVVFRYKDPSVLVWRTVFGDLPVCPA